MFKGIPVIGISGGIGSGKSYIARLFSELGCLVIDSDRQVTLAYQRPEVVSTLKQWWGELVVGKDGLVDRRVIAGRIFAHPADRKRLEDLLHPLVAQLRDVEMERAAEKDTRDRPKAFIWDTPLLFETGLWKECDVLIFVEALREERLRRVTQSRGWDDAELRRREISQWPLDNKRQLSHYVLENSARAASPRETQQAGKPHANPDEPRPELMPPETMPAEGRPATQRSTGPVVGASLRDQIQLVLSRILEKSSGSGLV